MLSLKDRYSIDVNDCGLESVDEMVDTGVMIRVFVVSEWSWDAPNFERKILTPSVAPI